VGGKKDKLNYVGPCHQDMARPLVTDGGDSFQMWRVAANISNKQWRTAEKGWSN